MDPSRLSSRLRDILGAGAARTAGVSPPAAGAEPLPACVPVPVPAPRVHGGALERVLGGEWRGHEGAACFTVERRVAPQIRYGRGTVGDLAAFLERGAAQVSIVAGGRPAPPPFVFFDLETTGLSGGAGTYAFLVGCGWFDESGAFVTRQYLLTRPADERALLAGVDAALAGAGAIVTFNGKSFDAPVLETRYLFHRLDWTGTGLPHVDMLHPARRFWGSGAARGIDSAGCSLSVLERTVLGVVRHGDVPGFEVPARYFRFVRGGDAGMLAGILEHNRGDLLALAGLTTSVIRLVNEGPKATCDAREALALGTLYSRAGFEERAREAYARAVELAESTRDESTPKSIRGAPLPVAIASLRALALASRRMRRFEEAARCWDRLLDTPGCPVHVMHEAVEALAIHHEHRSRNLAAAKTFALRVSEERARRHRLARIERKLVGDLSGRRPALPFGPSGSSPSPLSSGSPTSAPRTSS